MIENAMPRGSVVRLKSGGPKMTIEIYYRGMPKCIYFYEGKLQHLTTFKENLELVKEDEEDEVLDK